MNDERTFFSTYLKVEFVVDLETQENRLFSVYYRFPSKDYSNWKKLNEDFDFLEDLKQAVISERMLQDDGDKNPLG